MKIFRLAPKASVSCHDCHNPAEVEINLGAKRPVVHLCAHDMAYLVKVGTYRLEEIRSKAPIPKARQDDDSRGNR